MILVFAEEQDTPLQSLAWLVYGTYIHKVYGRLSFVKFQAVLSLVALAWVGCARLARNMQGGDEAHVSEFSLLVSFLLMQGDDSALAVIRGVYIVWSFSPLSFDLLFICSDSSQTQASIQELEENGMTPVTFTRLCPRASTR